MELLFEIHQMLVYKFGRGAVKWYMYHLYTCETVDNCGWLLTIKICKYELTSLTTFLFTHSSLFVALMNSFAPSPDCRVEYCHLASPDQILSHRKIIISFVKDDVNL